MIRRIQVWAFMRLCGILKPEISLWRMDRNNSLDSAYEIASACDFATVEVHNGRTPVVYDVLMSPKARGARRVQRSLRA